MLLPVFSLKLLFGLSDARGSIHRRVIIKKTWLSAFSYAQSRILLVKLLLGFKNHAREKIRQYKKSWFS
jgi:hypothetical protein